MNFIIALFTKNFQGCLTSDGEFKNNQDPAEFATLEAAVVEADRQAELIRFNDWYLGNRTIEVVSIEVDEEGDVLNNIAHTIEI